MINKKLVKIFFVKNFFLRIGKMFEECPNNMVVYGQLPDERVTEILKVYVDEEGVVKLIMGYYRSQFYPDYHPWNWIKITTCWCKFNSSKLLQEGFVSLSSPEWIDEFEDGRHKRRRRETL